MAHTVTVYDGDGHRRSQTTDVRDRAYRLFDEAKALIDAGRGNLARVEMRTDGLLHAQHGAAEPPEPQPEPVATVAPAPAPEPTDTVVAHAPAKPKKPAAKEQRA